MISTILVSLTLFVVMWLLVFLQFKSNFNYWKSKGVPFIKPKFFFGSILEIALGRVHPGKYIAKFYHTFDEPYFGFYAFNRPYLVAKDPGFIKKILITDFKHFTNRYFVSDERIDQINSNGLFAIKNPIWKWLRNKLNPFFSLAKLKLMVPLIQEHNDHMHKFILENVEKSIEIKEMCAKYTTDTIVSCFFGIAVNSHRNNIGFRMAGKRILSQSLTRSIMVLSYYYAPALVKIFKFKFIEPKAVDFLRSVFEKTMNAREESKIKRNDFLDLLIELKCKKEHFNGYRFEGDNAIAQAVTFFSAGFESSASTFAFTLHELGVNVHIQERLREEIKDTIRKYGSVSYTAVQEMKYLDMVIAESLRKYPTTCFVHRECVEDYTVEETGLVVEKGTPIIIAQHGLHFDPNYFSNPYKFDPERFNSENIHKIESCTYIPFGDGPRNCIGQMFGLLVVKMGLIEVLRHFIIETNIYTKEPVILAPFPIIQAKGGLPLTFRRLLEKK
ncbi:hypothetical protein FQA39_LY15352 [Lamprigera yunnana]|nr:hypothetical protein FQA39_LY15352 [Lamprigera yunnana]